MILGVVGQKVLAQGVYNATFRDGGNLDSNISSLLFGRHSVRAETDDSVVHVRNRDSFAGARRRRCSRSRRQHCDSNRQALDDHKS
ncbi:MAG TPA: hypothetical protein VFV02_01125 [Acidimicrobiales bacterium]|nr:hypothetical protein [Acidimicrobiales bacterium]